MNGFDVLFYGNKQVVFDQFCLAIELSFGETPRNLIKTTCHKVYYREFGLDNIVKVAEQNKQSDLHFRSSLITLLLPALIIAIGYGSAWGWLHFNDQSHSAIARLCMFVLVLGVPLLIAYNVLKFATLGIRLFDDYLIVHKGFPARDPMEIDYQFIKNVELEYGWLGQITGVASMHIYPKAGKPITVSGLRDPQIALKAVHERCVN